MTTESDHLGPVVTREGILSEAQRLHDLRYGTDHCDRKYVQVCSQFQSLLFEAGQNLRTPSDHPSAYGTPVRHPGAAQDCRICPPGQD